MNRRRLSAIVAAALAFALSGCSVFNKEYLSVSQYTASSASDFSSDVTLISSYDGLTEALRTMVKDHRTESRLQFSDYGGSLQTDLEKACSEVKDGYALASYAVDYMSYDISRITTYYEAMVYITYKHTQKEISAIQYVSSIAALREQLGTVLDGLGAGITVSTTGDALSVDSVTKAMGDTFAENPASCVVQPSVAVTMYPESGATRIIEIKLEYGWKQTELKKMKQALGETVEELRSEIYSDSDTVYALRAFNRLCGDCQYDPSGQGRDKTDLNSGLGSTAYGALCEGYADSRGIALAFSALCYQKSIACYVVSGTMDGAEHSWNIVKLDGSWYHVDISANGSLGIANAFLRTDEQMRQHYSWTTADYPACTGTKTYNDARIIAG